MSLIVDAVPDRRQPYLRARGSSKVGKVEAGEWMDPNFGAHAVSLLDVMKERSSVSRFGLWPGTKWTLSERVPPPESVAAIAGNNRATASRLIDTYGKSLIFDIEQTMRKKLVADLTPGSSRFPYVLLYYSSFIDGFDEWNDDLRKLYLVEDTEKR